MNPAHDAVLDDQAQNTGQNPPEISIFIGDEEIKNFVVSTLNEANAVSGGASF